MSATEWKPGDVIADEGGSIFWVVPTYPEDSCRPMPRGIDADGNDWFLNTIEGPTLRRLVVLDPESAEDSTRLAEALYLAGMVGAGNADGEYRTGVADRVQAALRELANPTPPKPDEPTGLGAVVEARDGELYVRDKTTTTVAHWKRARGMERGERHRYSDLPVVRVLSEGVSD